MSLIPIVKIESEQKYYGRELGDRVCRTKTPEQVSRPGN